MMHKQTSSTASGPPSPKGKVNNTHVYAQTSGAHNRNVIAHTNASLYPTPRLERGKRPSHKAVGIVKGRAPSHSLEGNEVFGYFLPRCKK